MAELIKHSGRQDADGWPPLASPKLHSRVSIECATSRACVWLSQMGVFGLEVDRILDLPNYRTNNSRAVSRPFFLYLSVQSPKVVKWRNWNSKHLIFFSHESHPPPPRPCLPTPLLTPVIAALWEPWCGLGPPGFSYSGEAPPPPASASCLLHFPFLPLGPQPVCI